MFLAMEVRGKRLQRFTDGSRVSSPLKRNTPGGRSSAAAKDVARSIMSRKAGSVFELVQSGFGNLSARFYRTDANGAFPIIALTRCFVDRRGQLTLEARQMILLLGS